MDRQRKDHIDPEGPPQVNHPAQLQNHHLSTNDVENINSTNKGRDLLLANKPRIVSWGTERVLQRIQSHRGITLHRSAHPQWEQDQTEKSSYGTWVDYKKAYDMVPQSWMINCLKMYKISDEVINLIEKSMKTSKVELTTGGRSLAEVKVQRGIFQGDSLSPLLFIITKMPLNHRDRKCTARYKLSESQEKINHLMYMDDIKLFAENEKELETQIHAREYTLRT